MPFPPPEITDLEAFNEQLLKDCMEDLEREHYVKEELISKLFAAEQEALVPLPGEAFRVFTIEKAKTDKYSFIHYEHNRYSTSPEYAKCEMWLEIGAYELRVLNGKYEHTQLKVSVNPEIAAAFKERCLDLGVSMTSEITRFMTEKSSTLGCPTQPSMSSRTVTVGTRPQRRKAVKYILDLLGDIIDAETQYMDNIPQNLRNSRNYDMAEQSLSALEEAAESLENAY
jgi:hypothetical protein